MNTPVAESETSVWLEKARSLGPIIAQYRDESEQQRHLASPVYEAMRELGLLKLWMPKSLGGAEMDIHTILEMIEELAYFDGSACWNFVIALQTGGLMGFMQEDVAATMVADDPNVTGGGSGQPGGVAIPVEGGYKISGRWPFASGVHHVRWFGCNCTVQEDGETKLDAEGNPELRMMFVSSDQFEILDTWHTTGLRASGSHDIVVTDAFVPEGRYIAGMATKSPFQSGTIFQTRIALLLGPPLSAVGIGIAREAIDAFTELALRKKRSRATKTLAEYDHTLMVLGQAEAKVNAARAYLHRSMCEHLWPEMLAGRGDSEAAAIDVFYASAFTAQATFEAVEMLHEAAGTSGVYEGNPLERCFRDISMVRLHAGSASSNFARGGAYKLGLGFSMRR